LPAFFLVKIKKTPQAWLRGQNPPMNTKQLHPLAPKNEILSHVSGKLSFHSAEWSDKKPVYEGVH
jgi:hypothetical protein